MLNPSLDIHEASSVEVDQLLAVWIEKAIHMEKINLPMWNIAQFTIPGLNEKYPNPMFYVATIREEIVGGFILIENDKKFWPEIISNDSLYLHKLVVRNGFGGKGYSHIMLEWIKELGKKKEKKYIRLDFDEPRLYLKNMYYSHGFIPVSEPKNIDGYIIVKAEYCLE